MIKRKTISQPNITIVEIIARFFLGFLFPYVAINGLILFLFVSSPKITIKSTSYNNHTTANIDFTIDCALPIVNISIKRDDNEYQYKKAGDNYTVSVKSNGTYLISATALNQTTSTTYATVDDIDENPPTIDMSTITYVGETLSFNIIDNESGINYDKIYALTKDNDKIEPSYIDRATGTIHFKLSDIKGVVIHIEDINGNFTQNEF